MGEGVGGVPSKVTDCGRDFNFARTAALQPTLYDFQRPRVLLHAQREHGTSEFIVRLR